MAQTVSLRHEPKIRQNGSMVKSFEIRVRTSGHGNIVDLTPEVADCVEKSRMATGLATVFVVGSTAAITTIEFEPGLCRDLPRVLERLVPSTDDYRHELTWHDDNGHSHVQAALLGPSLTVPIINGRLALGTWQQTVLVELDTRPRERQVIVQIIGEQVTPSA